MCSWPREGGAAPRNSAGVQGEPGQPARTTSAAQPKRQRPRNGRQGGSDIRRPRRSATPNPAVERGRNAGAGQAGYAAADTSLEGHTLRSFTDASYRVVDARRCRAAQTGSSCPIRQGHRSSSRATRTSTAGLTALGETCSLRVVLGASTVRRKRGTGRRSARAAWEFFLAEASTGRSSPAGLDAAAPSLQTLARTRRESVVPRSGFWCDAETLKTSAAGPTLPRRRRSQTHSAPRRTARRSATTPTTCSPRTSRRGRPALRSEDHPAEYRTNSWCARSTNIDRSSPWRQKRRRPRWHACHRRLRAPPAAESAGTTT